MNMPGGGAGEWVQIVIGAPLGTALGTRAMIPTKDKRPTVGARLQQATPRSTGC